MKTSVSNEKPDEIKNLLLSFIQNDYERYKTISSDLGIDLEENLITKLTVRNEKDGMQESWKYTELYSWYKNILLPDVCSNKISFWNQSMENNGINCALVKKYFPLEEHGNLHNNELVRKDRLIEMVIKIIKILWLNEPVFDEPVYLVRCNYDKDPASMVDDLYDANKVSICIKDDEDDDRNYFANLIAGNNPPYNKKLLYIHRFVALANLVRATDVITIATYTGKETKIGLIKKGSQINPEEKDGYKLYCLEMKSVYCNPNGESRLDSIDLRAFPILKSIIPYRPTISAVKQRTSVVYGIYYGVKQALSLSQLTDSAIESMCTEWLRSRFANETYRICYQIIRTGGNFADIDILGSNSEGKIIAAQISNTNNKKLINNKIDALNHFQSDHKIMFSMSNEAKINGCVNICIADIWRDFESDKLYQTMLERLARL